MKKILIVTVYFLTILTSVASTAASVQILQTNNLNRPASRIQSKNSESQYNFILDELERVFTPIVSKHNRILTVVRSWNESGVNTYTGKYKEYWVIDFPGGLFRHEKMTEDGFAFFACSAIGTFLSGYYFFDDKRWLDMSAYGSSDYFATQVCLREIWKDKFAENEASRKTAVSVVIKKCEDSWPERDEQNICIRSAMAVLPKANIMAALQGDPEVSFFKSDTSVVNKTSPDFLSGQCTLDNALAGALCGKSYDLNIIPGFESNAIVHNGLESENESLRYTCSKKSGDKFGFRPSCWFKER